MDVPLACYMVFAGKSRVCMKQKLCLFHRDLAICKHYTQIIGIIVLLSTFPHAPLKPSVVVLKDCTSP